MSVHGRCVRSSTPFPRQASVVATLLALLPILWTALVPGAGFAQNQSTAGQWAATPHEMGLDNIAIHLALLPGGTSSPYYHSRIVWWTDNSRRGMWGWRSIEDGCASWPAANFDGLSFPAPPNGMNDFCAGLSVIDHLIVCGGSQGGANGITRAATFDPDRSPAWIALPDLEHPRWYPTVTVLPATEPDGPRAYVTGGHRLHHLASFGGNPATGSADDALRRFGNARDGTWDSAILPAPQQEWPSARSGHAAQPRPDVEASFLMFGGQDQTTLSYLDET